MRRKIRQVDGRLGAPMGRRERHKRDKAMQVKLAMQQVRINSGGYDSGGAYWGIGDPLYWYASDCGQVEGYLRACNREAAKADIREKYPAARFYR